MPLPPLITFYLLAIAITNAYNAIPLILHSRHPRLHHRYQ